MEMREIAWASLDDTAKETVIGNWKDAKGTEEIVIPKVQLNGEEKPIKVMKGIHLKIDFWLQLGFILTLLLKK